MSRARNQREEHFGTVVVGSGFGGSVVTYRLANAGLDVCLLERGQTYPPGSFPRSPYGMSRAFWDPSKGCYGMFSVWSFANFGAVVSSGLGGGSLIYANVMLRKDEQWFADDAGESWPVTYAELERHYAAVEQMLDVQPFPFSREPYSRSTRTNAFVRAADALRWKWFTPPLAVSFAPDDDLPGEPIRGQQPNLHGSTRLTCRLVGECDIGCNYGAKNSLDYTYLSRAKEAGAQLRSLHEVRRFERLSDGRYRIHYVVHDRRQTHPRNTHDKRVLEPTTMTAERLVLAAGSLGTTYLLLRNRAAFPQLSERLGTQFSGNGDLLTMAIRPKRVVVGPGVEEVIEGSDAPAITVAVRFADALDGSGAVGRGFYLEDAGFPALLSWLLEAGGLPAAMWRWRHIAVRLLRKWIGGTPETDVSAELAALIGGSGLSSGVMPLLGMGRDVPGGQMSLAGRELKIDWKLDPSREYFMRVRREMRRFVRALGATFADNPLWHIRNRVITVHPLGGVPMATAPDHGVVDPWGRVFHYPGLYVADGSVMPGSVGPNPSLTIAAIADRIADGIIERAKQGLA